jgi:hypothetical protein
VTAPNGTFFNSAQKQVIVRHRIDRCLKLQGAMEGLSGHPGRLRALSVFHIKSPFDVAFVWAHRAFGSPSVLGPGSDKRMALAKREDCPCLPGGG